MAKYTIEEVLENFQNGEVRYSEDLTFRHAIDSLAAGIGHLAVLDSTLAAFARFKAVTEKQHLELNKQLNAEKLSRKNP